MLATEDLLPQRVIDQYQMTPEMWADKIKLWYTDFQGMQRYVSFASAVRHFLIITMSMSMSNTFIGGAVCQEFESEAVFTAILQI